MAKVDHTECPVCEATTVHYNGKCNECRTRERKQEVAKWNAQTTNQKLRDLRLRLERLEAGPPKY